MSEDKDTENPAFTSTFDHIFSFSRLNHDCQAIHDVIKENILANEHLHTSIELLNSTLVSQSENNSFIKPFIPIISVIIGVILGFISTRFHWEWTEKEKKKTDSFTKISTLISELETLSVEYWTKDHCEDDEKTEIYIKSKIRLLTKYVKSIDAKQKTIKQELDNFTSDIFDLVTGDEFESKDRRASKNKAISISYRCTDINAAVASHC
ncbi:hypothetical protein [Nitrosomonas communis]|uniref:hypothetical protein n=1 Tax=Nitrosomonas communis TaxID=44574 RepID=UPI0026EAE70C|nr:hypothetical protein [Nitrosomonas communis]MCO6428078.1 hypothetical protein [Nitrosomonas communis]